MRHLIAALLLSPLAMYAQDKGTAPAKPEAKIDWVSMEKVQELVKKAPRPVIVDVYTEWCGPCKMLAARTFTDPRVVAFVNTHFYAVKFNAEGGEPVTFKGKTYTNPQFDATRTAGRNGTHELTMAIAPANGRVAYPTVVYLDKDLNVLAPVQGFLTPEQIEPIFRYFGEGHYTSKDYATYMQGFVATWQGEP